MKQVLSQLTHTSYTSNCHTTANPALASLLTNIKSSLPKYATELWTHFKTVPGQSLVHLTNYLNDVTGPLLIISDASLNSQKQSAFSCIICTTTQELWTRAGTIPRTQCNAHLGWAEGFGLLATFTFLEHYLQHSSITLLPSPPMIHGYCNNLSLQTSKIPNPSCTITNDYDLMPTFSRPYSRFLSSCNSTTWKVTRTILHQ